MTRSSLRPSLRINLDTLGAILVTLTPLVYFNAALRGNITLASEDGILFNVPLRIAAANIMRQGSLPLWNPYLFSGMPLHAAAQGGVLFPLNWFYLFFDAPAATNLMALSTYMVAALGAYLYARRSGSSIAGAIVTSFVWQWCGLMIGQFSHVNIVQTAALLPWLLWAIDGYGTRGQRRWAFAVAGIVMLQAFTGHQQTLVYSLLLASAYAIVMWRATKPPRTWYLWSLVLLAAGMLLAAVQILPTYELMRNSLRARASFQFFTDFSLPPKFLLTFFAPYLMGGGDGRLFRAPYVGAPFYGEFIGYVGLATLMLAVMAIVLKRDARTKFWAIVAVIAFILALGRYWPFKLYAIIYYVPILNLFRAPARHLMEVDLALAVLAGRGLTALAGTTDRKRAARLAFITGIVVFVLTFLIVTLGRPAAFRLGREAPVTLLHAPELFLPLFLAAVSLTALWWYARARKTVALCMLLGLLALDLCIWGHSSGWRIVTPPPDSVIWEPPPPLKALPHEPSGAEPYRLLTVQRQFDPNQKVEDPLSVHYPLVFWLHPNIYMMHGSENASGYDGFGLARYSRLAGDMTVWGELPKPDQTLRGPGRELDILNVKYVLAMSTSASGNETTFMQSFPTTQAVPGTQTLPATQTDASRVPSSVPSSASQEIAGERFATEDLRLASIGKDSWLVFEAPSVATDRIALLTNLSWSLDLPDGTPVARLTLRAENGRRFDFELQVGEHTSEWSYDRPDIRARIKNRRAKVATSYQVKDAQGRYQGHTYLSVFKLPERAVITRGEIKVIQSDAAPDLSLTVHRISLADGNMAVPVRPEWISRRTAREGHGSPFGRWLRVGEVEDVSVFENTRVLPRAWLASSFEVLKENELLEVIRSGSLPNGNVWDPRRTVLVENPIEFAPDVPEDSSASAALTDHQANRIQIRTTSVSPSILVLSENFYPGWRAYVDGESSEILRVNYNLRGLLLREGEHVVEFAYRPWSVLIGLAISIVTALVLALWGIGRFERVIQALHWERGRPARSET